jgi:hypothetical protein
VVGMSPAAWAGAAHMVTEALSGMQLLTLEQVGGLCWVCTLVAVGYCCDPMCLEGHNH